MSNVIGYARISTHEPAASGQEVQLRTAGVERVFVDHAVHPRVNSRPQWVACLEALRPGDILIVPRLDRIASTERMAIETINLLHERGVDIRSLAEPDIDTTTPAGHTLFAITAVLAQMRADAFRNAVTAGLAHARTLGRVGGRPSVMTPQRIEAALTMRAAGASIQHIADTLGVGSSSVSRALIAQRADNPSRTPPS
jgi:DNA invertase Pin-like site-specific DNA recombinase